MTVRLFIVPLLRTGNNRYPKYFASKFNASPLVSPLAMTVTDYGLIDYALIAADVSPTDITNLQAQSDVLVIPANLDNTLTAGAVTTTKNFLENFNIPANWVTAGDTYRSVVRTVTAMFLFMQRVTAILGHGLDFTSVPLSTQFGSLPADVQSALVQAATDLGYSTAGLTSTTTLRQILKSMADAWGTTVIHLGLMDL